MVLNASYWKPNVPDSVKDYFDVAKLEKAHRYSSANSQLGGDL